MVLRHFVTAAELLKPVRSHLEEGYYNADCAHREEENEVFATSDCEEECDDGHGTPGIKMDKMPSMDPRTPKSITKEGSSAAHVGSGACCGGEVCRMVLLVLDDVRWDGPTG